MGMRAWLQLVVGVAKRRWAPYALVGVVTAASTMFAAGYFRGASITEARMDARMAAALRTQMRDLRRAHTQDMVRLEATMRLEREVKDAMGDVEFPEVEPDCRDFMYEWMRSFNAGVRASRPSARAPDEAAQ